MMLYLDKISISFGGPSKSVCPPQRGWASPNPLWARIEPKAGGRSNLALPAWLTELGHLSSPALRTPGSQAFRFKLITPSALLGFQLADSRSWNFSASIIMCTNSHNKSPYINTIYGSFSLENANTGEKEEYMRERKTTSSWGDNDAKKTRVWHQFLYNVCFFAIL